MSLGQFSETIEHIQSQITSMQEKLQTLDEHIQSQITSIRERLEALESNNIPSDEELLYRRWFNQRQRQIRENGGQAQED